MKTSRRCSQKTAVCGKNYNPGQSMEIDTRRRDAQKKFGFWTPDSIALSCVDGKGPKENKGLRESAVVQSLRTSFLAILLKRKETEDGKRMEIAECFLVSSGNSHIRRYLQEGSTFQGNHASMCVNISASNAETRRPGSVSATDVARESCAGGDKPYVSAQMLSVHSHDHACDGTERFQPQQLK